MGSLRAHFFIALIPEFFLAGVEQATWLPAVGALASPVLPRRRIRTARVIGCFDYDRRFPRSASADPGQYDYDDARSLSGGPRRLDLSLSRGYDDGLEPMHASHVAARAVLVAKAAPRALPAARQVDAAWGPLHQYAHGPGPMTAIEHINYRHAFNSGFDNVSRFAQGTTTRQIQSYVDDALRYGNVTQSGASIQYDVGRVIGYDQAGNAVTGIQVWVRNGYIRTAFPVAP
jgi:hypothetical protein